MRGASSNQRIPLEISAACCIMNMLCFPVLISSCVKFQESNDKTQLIFGSITNIQAKDAAPVEVNAGTFLEKLKVTMLRSLHRLENTVFVLL